MTSRRKAGAGVMTRREMPMGTGTDMHTTSPQSFDRLVVARERFALWRYSVRDLGELTVFSPTGATRAEMLHELEFHYPGRVLTLRPVGGGM